MPPETRTCQNCKNPFTIEPEDFEFYEKVKVPPPTFCWLCRAQRRMAWRNESRIFRRRSDRTGKEIFSAFASDAPVRVYENEVWLSDQWDPMQYGRDYDFNRPFFIQFKELLNSVPLKSRNVVGGVNSDYCNNFTDPKNSYLVFNGQGAEDCLYGNGLGAVKDCVDISHTRQSEECYESFWLTSCARTMFSAECEDSFDLIFCRDCVGCNNCFGSVGLHNKSYHIFNKAYTKEEYERNIQAFDLSSWRNLETMKERVKRFWSQFPIKFISGTHNTTVSGNYISYSKNVRNSFLIREGEDLRYCQYSQELPSAKDTYDYTAWGAGNELVYECAACGLGTHSIKFCYNVQEDVRDIEYSYMCSGSSDLFGCVGLRKKQHCILNKLYEKDSYHALRKRIIEHMHAMPHQDLKGRQYRYGEFFPIELSPFAYNETLAQEYFPYTKSEVHQNGFLWRDPLEKNYPVTLPADQLPDRIGEVTDSITSEIIGCLHAGNCRDQCTKAFRIIPAELRFYRKRSLPLPRVCPNCRHFERLRQRTGLQLWDRRCGCAGATSENAVYQNTTPHFHQDRPCPNEFETSYSPERPEIVYCEQCYQAEAM